MKGGIEILIDFDGTCVTHSFPEVGNDIGAVPVLKELTDNGHKLILFTMRSNRISFSPTPIGIVPDLEGRFLNDAILWFINNDIPLYGVQSNPTQHKWTESPKAYGQLIIDDTCLGIPLIHNKEISNRPYVDWLKVKELLKMRNLI
jgi:hypothetical protein